MTPTRFEIRPAGVSDAALIATQRTRMFQEMGLVPESLFEAYRARCESSIREVLQSGEYIGWLPGLTNYGIRSWPASAFNCATFCRIRLANRAGKSASARAAMPS